MHETTDRDTSQKWADAVFFRPELRKRFEEAAARTMATEPVPDDFSQLTEFADPTGPRDERLSLHPLSGEEALRALLSTPHKD